VRYKDATVATAKRIFSTRVSMATPSGEDVLLV
jgi:hypothetical protein